MFSSRTVPPSQASRLSICGIDRMRQQGVPKHRTKYEGAGPMGCLLGTHEGAAQGPRTLGQEYPHQYRGSKCRAGAGPPQACCPGGENRSVWGRQASLPPRNGAVRLENYVRLQPMFWLVSLGLLVGRLPPLLCGPHGSGWTPTLTKPCSEATVSTSNISN